MRPINQNKAYRGSYAKRPLIGLRTGTAPRMNAPPPAVPIDPTNPSQKRGR